jgi:hypothetical protein
MPADQGEFCNASLELAPLEQKIMLDVLRQIEDPTKKERLFNVWGRRLCNQSCASRVGAKRGIDHDAEAPSSVGLMVCKSGRIKKTPSALQIKLCEVVACVEGTRTILLREIEGEVFSSE